MNRYAFMLVLAGLIAACNTAPSSTATSAPTATAALAPSATTAPPTATVAPSDTASPTATDRPTVTPTDTPVSTDTPRPTTTAPRPTAVPATAVPTATTPPLRAPAPVFPNTGIGAWDSADFRKEIGELYNNTQAYRANLQSVLDGRSQSSCRALYTYTDDLYNGQRGYSDVPDVWYPAYYEYRVLIDTVFQGLVAQAVNCPRGREPSDGQYDAQQAALAIPALDAILSRVPQILNETAGLP